MPKANQNTQYVVLGLAAAAAAGLVFLWFQQQKATTGPSKKLDDSEDFSQATTKASNATTTAKKLDDEDRMDEKALHAKIEELDKKGKAYFKGKKVRIFLHLFLAVLPCKCSSPFQIVSLPVGYSLFLVSFWRPQKPLQ